jgi:hypothetical protein
VSLFIISVFGLLLIIGCTFDGRTRRLMFEVESLPIGEPLVVADPIVIEENIEIVKKPAKSNRKRFKKHKRKHKKKGRQKSGNNKSYARANNAVLAAN